MRDSNGVEYSLDEFISYAPGRKIVIFGVGDYGTYIYKVLKKNDIEVYAMCDNNKEKLCALRDKYPVSTLENLRGCKEECYFIIGIAKIDIVKAIRSQLHDFGVQADKMIIPLPDTKSGYFHSLIMFDSEYWIPAVKEQWQHARQCSTQIVDYFETNDLFKLIVFENDAFKGWLERDLLHSKVVIRKKISSLEDFTEEDEYDAVVVLDEANYEGIEEQLMRRTKVPIISIWDVVRF